MDQITRNAFLRLLNVAKGDTGQSSRVANFVLAWWNSPDLGAFDLTDLFAVDEEIASDIARVFSYLASRSVPEYPSEYRVEIEEIVRIWRPRVWTDAIASPEP